MNLKNYLLFIKEPFSLLLAAALALNYSWMSLFSVEDDQRKVGGMMKWWMGGCLA
jgi:hypothetical protein